MSNFNASISDGYTRVEAVAAQPDGKIIAGGTFPLANGIAKTGLARFNADGSLDNSFSGISGFFTDIVVQPDGKILVAGSATGVARLNSDGSPDAAFTPGVGASSVSDILLLPDSKIVIAGTFTQYNGTAISRIAKLNTDGTLDTSFVPPTINSSVFEAAVQANDQIVIVGGFSMVGGVTRQGSARLNIDGTLDTSFNAGTSTLNSRGSVAVQPDGQILVGGVTSGAGIIRLNPDGTMDPSFTAEYPPGTTSTVHKMIVLPDGKIVAGGAYGGFGGPLDLPFAVVKLNTDGSLDPGFTRQLAIDGGYEVFSIDVTPDGKIVAVGDLYKFGSISSVNKRIAKLNADGTIDNGFVGSIEGFGVVNIIVQQPDGKVIVGGRFEEVNGDPRRNIVRLNADGTIDPSFNAGTSTEVRAVAIQPDGKIVIGGDFFRVNDTLPTCVARLNADGSIDKTFASSTFESGRIYSFALQSDGKLLVGGVILNKSGQTGIIRLNSDGSNDSGFSVPVNNTFFVYKILLLSTGQMYVAGSFSNFGGSGRARIARLDSNGTVDNTFDTGTGPNTNVYTLIQQPDEKVLIGGFYTTFNGNSSPSITRLNVNGSFDPTFNVGLGFNARVQDLTIQPDGLGGFAILAGGTFSTYDGAIRPGLAKLNEDGSLNNLNVNVNGAVNEILAQTDGEVLIGGMFNGVGGQPRASIARLNVEVGTGCITEPIDFGQAINGTLTPTSCSISGPTDFYSFDGVAGQQIAISLDAIPGDLRPFLELMAPDGQITTGVSSFTNARIPSDGFFPLPLSGTYTIRTSSAPQAFGDYTISLSEQPVNGCTYTVAPDTTYVNPVGGTFFFDVLSGDGCPSVTASVDTGGSFLQIISNTGGRVTFDVNVYGEVAERTGSIVAGGQTHTITQFGINPPTNDFFAQAEVLPGTAGVANGRNNSASAESNEPAHAGSPADRSVWYSWTAPADPPEGGLYSFTTSGSNFDTVMAIYTGTSVDDLIPVAENDDTTAFDPTSKINLRAAAGVTYFIAVDGKNGENGSIQLSYRPYRRLFRLYLQNFNGFASPIIPTSLTALRQDGTGPMIPGESVSLGVYEFDLPDDNSPYGVTIAGPDGITWQPSTYVIDNASGRFDESMLGGTGGGQNQTSNPTNTIPRRFKGFINGISTQPGLSVLKVRIASAGSSSSVPPRDCPNPVLVSGLPGAPMRTLYECITQPNTVHQIVPNAPQKAFEVPVLALPVINIDTGPSSANAIAAADSPTFDITGQVHSGGEPLSNVDIDITAGTLTMRVTTDTAGNYIAPNLLPNRLYTLRAFRTGYVFQPQTINLQPPGATVNLAAESCTYSVGGNRSFGSTGGPGELRVTAVSPSCIWIAGRDSQWITIQSSSSFGNGSVQFAVLPNNGPPREGAITAGQQSFTISQSGATPGIKGSVAYQNAVLPKPVPGTSLSAPGKPAVNAVTDTSGNYAMTGFAPGAPYTVTPTRGAITPGASNGIFTNDAALIARHVVGIPPLLNEQQQAAGKVSGGETLSALDAGLIARWIVGLTGGQTGHWRFTPVDRVYPSIDIIHTDQNYTGLLMGDVSGDWNAAGARRTLPFSGGSVLMSVPVTTHASGPRVTIPLRLDDVNENGIGSYQFDIEFDPDVISPERVAADVSNTMSQGLVAVSNSPIPGLLKVAVYGTLPVSGDGVYINLHFILAKAGASSSPIKIVNARVGDGSIPVMVASGRIITN